MPETLAESICQAIRDDIVEGRLNHQAFLTEGGLAERFSVSKAPVRDALHRLCQEEYLVSYPRKGYMINIITRDELNQVQEVRAHLEQMCIKLVIQNCSDEEIDSLMETIALSGHERDPYKTNNTRFHQRLAELSGNHFLYNVVYSLLGIGSRAVILRFIRESDSTNHRLIIEALKKRDEEAAINALKADIQLAY